MKACAEAEDEARALAEAASVGGRRLAVETISGGSKRRMYVYVSWSSVMRPFLSFRICGLSRLLYPRRG